MLSENKKRQYVGVILVRPDGSVLSQHRDNIPTILGPDTWAVLGGRKEDEDQNLTSAAARELKEETDYEISESNLRFLTRDDYITEKGVPVERTIFWAMYDGKQQINCLEGQEIRFITPSEFSSLNFYTGHEGFFRKAAEKVFSLPIERKG